MQKNKKQQYKDMISINFYPKEIEKFIEFLDMVELAIGRWCNADKEDKRYFNEIDIWRQNFKLFLKSFKGGEKL